jgi:pilus assembly protein CpaF
MPASPFESSRPGETPDANAGGRAAGFGPMPPRAANGDPKKLSPRERLHDLLLATLVPESLQRLSDKELRKEIARVAHELAIQHSITLDPYETDKLIDTVQNDLMGHGPIEKFLLDQDVNDILINGPRQLFVERKGQLEATTAAFKDEHHLVRVIRRMIAPTGRMWDEQSPIVDARLPDGSRLNAVLKPPALNGPLVSIRRFGTRPLQVSDLLHNASLAQGWSISSPPASAAG